MKFSNFLIGVILILFGVIVFLINAGYGSWEMWWQIFKLWPLILIIFGIRMVWRDKLPSWVPYLIILAAALGIILLFILTPKSESWTFDHNLRKSDSIKIGPADYPNLSKGKIQAKFGGGNLTVGSSTSQWIEGSFDGYGATTRIGKDHGQLNLRLEETRRFSRRRRGNSLHWNINLSPKLDWDFSLEAGAFNGDFDLSKVCFHRLDLKFGASNVDLTLGDNGPDGKITIDAGASQIQVKVPENTGVKVKLAGALTGNNLNQLDWTQRDHYYTSPNYEKTTNHVTIDVNMAVGNFTITPVSNTGGSW